MLIINFLPMEEEKMFAIKTNCISCFYIEKIARYTCCIKDAKVTFFFMRSKLFIVVIINYLCRCRLSFTWGKRLGYSAK
jgi:hypothetical protein